ncbi:MAG: hypothetical protein LBH53_03410, partial [Puniceicoccales bacterium]|nr:hypothetical protein [Puniceicoccales bacterium]
NFQELLAHMPNIAEMEELTAYVAAVNCVAFHRAFDPILTEDMVAIYFPEGSPAPAEKIALIRPPSWDGERVVYCAKAKFLPAVPYRIVGPNEVGGFRGGPL